MGRDFGQSVIEEKRKQIGAGKSFDELPAVGAAGQDSMTAALLDKLQCSDVNQMPTLWQTRFHQQGPMLDANIQTIFQPQTDILSLGKSVPGASSVAQTQGLNNGALQTPSLICGVFVHVSCSPSRFTIPGASITKPAAGVSAPIVPDTWSLADVVSLSGAAGGVDTALGIAGCAAKTAASANPVGFRRASLNFNGWAQGALWAMVRAFNFVWSYGDKTTLLDFPLRFMASMPSNAQNGSSGSGPVETAGVISATNSFYATTGASTDIFQARNARRTGSVTVGGTPGIVSTFAPDDSFRQVVPTYGGVTLHDELGGMSRVFTLPRPVLYPRAVNLGMYLNEKDNTAFSEMQNGFSITNGAGLPPTSNATVPPVVTPYSNITAGYGAGSNGGITPTGYEQTKDLPPVPNYLQMRSDEITYKWGDFFIGIGAVGYELTEGQYQAISRNNGVITDALAAAGCPCWII